MNQTFTGFLKKNTDMFQGFKKFIAPGRRPSGIQKYISMCKYSLAANIKKRFAFVLLTSLTLSQAAFAAQWFNLFYASDGKTFVAFDKESVAKNGDVTTLWINMLERPSKSKSKSIKPTQNKVMLTKIDCGQKMIALGSVITYSESREILAHVEGSGNFEPAIPDTIGASIAKAVCEQGFPEESKPKKYIAVKNGLYSDAEVFFLVSDAFKGEDFLNPLSPNKAKK